MGLMNNKTKTFAGIFAILAGITLALAPAMMMSLPNAEAQAGPCTNLNPNSACSYAPGHGGVPPGQTDDPRANAPGHLKR